MCGCEHFVIRVHLRSQICIRIPQLQELVNKCPQPLSDMLVRGSTAKTSGGLNITKHIVTEVHLNQHDSSKKCSLQLAFLAIHGNLG